MIEEFRRAFNSHWTVERYRQLLQKLDLQCSTHIGFPVCETPVFLPTALLRTMEQSGLEIMTQLVSNAAYMEASRGTIPEKYDAPHEPLHPLFAAVDFGIIRGADGSLAPRLIELQGFPSLYAYQTILASEYQSAYALPAELTVYPPSLDAARYVELFKRAILGNCDPENVILLEIDPQAQKTLPDFLLTEKLCGITTVNIREVIRDRRRLFYNRAGRRILIERVYNRTIAEDLEKSGAQVAFRFNDDLEVEWAGHPNWFFRMSKYSLPFIHHRTAPKTLFLEDHGDLPDDISTWVLKPLFSFAGSGVNVHPTRESIEAIPRAHRSNYILQEKVEYANAVVTPQGPTKVEIRIMYIWIDQPVAVMNLVRMGRGAMMGVDHNKNMSWVGRICRVLATITMGIENS